MGFNDRSGDKAPVGERGANWNTLIVHPVSDDDVLAAAKTVAAGVDREDLVEVLEALGILDRVRELRRREAA